MRIPRHLALLLTLSLVATAALITSCSDNTTSPIGGGGVKELNSGTIAPGGGSFLHTFAGLGTFNYVCTFHAGMSGQIIVVNGAADSALVTIQDNSFAPSPASVRPGGSVRWVNTGALNHTVTSP